MLLKNLGGLSSPFVLMCRQSTDDITAEKIIHFHSKLEIFAWIVSVKLNYESVVDREGSKAHSFLKMTPDEISEAALRPVLWKRC